MKRKRSMSSLDLAAVISSLKGRLEGARVVNIYATDAGGLLLKLKLSSGEDVKLVAEPARRLHVTSFEPAEKGEPPPLVMGIRKHIRGTRVQRIEQLGFDRVAFIEFTSGHRLYVELLPRGVIALVDADGRILQATEFKEMKDRVIRRGEVYKPPPLTARSPAELKLEEVTEKLKGCDNTVRCLVRGFGLPAEMVEEALARLRLPKEGGLAGEDAAKLLEELRRIYEEATSEHKGYIISDEKGLPVTVLPFKPVEPAREYGDINEALDRYFVELARAEVVDQQVAALEAEKAKLEASIRQAEENLRRLEERINKLRKAAELLALNAAKLYEVYECIERVRSTAGWEYVPGNCPGVVDVEPHRGVVKLAIAGEVFDVSVRMPPHKLIVEMYKRIGELESKAERTRRALEELRRKLQELHVEIRSRAEAAKARIRRRQWYEKYHWLFTRSWVLAIGGRDASQNESVVKRYLNEKRIFMHADVRGAPAVVVFAEGRELSEEELREAAVLTACYSKAWKGGVGAVDVYWVWGSQVSKAAPAGEYLTKGAFMVYGKRNWIRNVELKLALGVAEDEGAPLVIVGPEELVKRRSLVYAVLAPGEEDPSKLAARLKRLFKQKLERDWGKGYLADALTVDEVRLRIPGRSRVLKLQRGEASEPPRPPTTSSDS